MIFCYNGLPFFWWPIMFGVAVIMAVCIQCYGKHFAMRCRRFVNRLASRPILAICTIATVALANNLLLSLICPPQPMIHDEFAYQLAADTYAQGRLTNPTHPMWRHFETFHVLSHPSYMAKYPPGNGLVLAVGQVLTGHSIVGTWLSISGGLAAMFWMLCAWVPARWALTGSLLLAVNAHMLMAWGQTWWGGGLQMLGGALLFGSLRRIVTPVQWHAPIWQYAAVFATGAVLLAITRPFEGLLACLVASGVLLKWLACQSHEKILRTISQLVLPMAVIGSVGVAFLLTNNRAVTGSASALPYSAHSRQYSSTSLILWNSPPPIKHYNLKRMESLYLDWSRNRQLVAQTAHGYFALAKQKLKLLWWFFPFAGGLCLVPLFYVARGERAWTRMACITILVVVAIELQLVHSNIFPHYVAPFAGLFYFLLIRGLRGWHAASRRHDLAKHVVTTVTLYTLLGFIGLAYFKSILARHPTPRSVVESILEDKPGDHLVFVNYPEDYSIHEEWVYNRADIDLSKIVWTHVLTSEQNNELSEYFAGRQQWIWHVGETPIKLLPYADTHPVNQQNSL